MPTGLKEGLGGEEVLASGTGALTQNPFFLGNMLVTGSITAGAGTNLVGSGILTGGSIVETGGAGFIWGTGSPYNGGVIIPITARTIISGGAFVIASGGLVMSATANSPHPLGVAQATTASGAVCNVIMYGIVPVIAEGTIAIGAGAIMGSGAAANTILPASALSGTRVFATLDAGASGTTVFIRL